MISTPLPVARHWLTDPPGRHTTSGPWAGLGGGPIGGAEDSIARTDLELPP
jgi:hypothetical protein